MLLIIRSFIAILYGLLVCTIGTVYCLFSPRNPCHVATFSHLFGRLSTLFGLKVEIRIPAGVAQNGNCIYIANHQNNYDMAIVSNIVQPGTVIVGKKSLLWIPFLGPLYWLSGNILINRNNNAKAHSTITMIIEQFKKRDISIWIFPEGTRSRGRGLMPFKTGAFYAAITAQVPIIPICISTTHDKINLNRWNNGRVIVEMIEPINTFAYSKKNARDLANYCHTIMVGKISELDTELAMKARLENNILTLK